MASTKQPALSAILSVLTLLGCIFRSSVLILALREINLFDKQHVHIPIYLFLHVYLAVYMALAITSLLLLYAIVNEKHTIMMPWLIVAVVCITCDIAFPIFINFNYDVLLPVVLLSPRFGHRLMYVLIGNGFSFWIFMVIWKLYKIVRHENRIKDGRRKLKIKIKLQKQNDKVMHMKY